MSAARPELRILIEAQRGIDYAQLRELAIRAEELGFSGFFVSDHLSSTDADVPDSPNPTEAWVTLAGLAVETRTINLGTLVSPVTFRHPGVLAVQAAQVDRMSGGRVTVGVGAGWFEREHTSFGLPFPHRRFDLLEEQLQILRGVWSAPPTERFSFEGEHYRLQAASALPHPGRRTIPLILGGCGRRRTPALAAAFADEFNAGVADEDETRARFGRVDAACEVIGRDPATLFHSVVRTVAVGVDGPQWIARAARLGTAARDLDTNGLIGSPDDVRESLDRLAEAGADRVYLRLLGVDDLEQLRLLGELVSAKPTG